mgnify:CR=1 FL=1
MVRFLTIRLIPTPTPRLVSKKLNNRESVMFWHIITGDFVAIWERQAWSFASGRRHERRQERWKPGIMK